MASAPSQDAQPTPRNVVDPVPLAKDRFSALPPELHRKIFSLAYSGAKGKPRGALSKTLLPFFLEAIYEEATIESYDQLSGLCRVVRAHTAYSKLIKLLSITIPLAIEVVISGEEAKETVQPASFATEDARHLVQHLSMTKKLVVEGSYPLISLILQPQTAIDALPSLKELYLASPFPGVKDPFHPALYAALTFYQLEHLGIRVERSSASIKPFSNPLPASPPLLFASVLRLILDGPVARSSAAQSLISSFPDICDLCLTDIDTPSSLLPLVRAVDNPAEIFALALNSSLGPYDRKFEDALLGFQAVGHLELSGRLVSPLPSFYDTLRQLPLLETLTIGLDASASTEELSSLVASGPRKHPSLKQLTLHNVWGKMGTRIEEDRDGEMYDPTIDRGNYEEFGGGHLWGIYPDWIPPQWTSEFTRHGLENLLQVAQASGVEVSGDAVQALEIEEAFEGECDWVAACEMEGEELEREVNS
ncbi:hypothetical protein JCM6882_008091 [Rhodosporidiobolus microsporus]